MSNRQVVVEVSPAVLNGLLHIKDVEPIGERDADLLSDIRVVLAKHGVLNRFGLTLLHKHYDLQRDEVLHETTDEENRVSEIRPITRDQFNEKIKSAEVTYTTVLFPESDLESPSGVVTLACAVSCTKHGFGKIHMIP
jgi:hypothetical protein